MKLSKIINQNKIRCATIDIYNQYVVVTSFFFGKSKPTLKVYKKLEIDMDLKEVSLDNVKHLGIKRYRSYTNLNFYANIYNY